MAMDKFSLRNLDPDHGGINAPLRSAEAGLPFPRGYPDGKTWELHPYDETALIRKGRPFLPLGVYARELLLRRDADVGRLMLSLAAHRANTLAFDLLAGAWEAPPGGAPLLTPWTVDRSTHRPNFERLHSAYFSRLDVLLHALTESDIALLIRLPAAADLARLQIPVPVWDQYLAELALRVAPYKEVAFAADLDGYNDLCRLLQPRVPEFRVVACLNLQSPAQDAARLAALPTLSPRPRLLWLHSESLLTPHFGASAWTGPTMHSCSRPGVRPRPVPSVPVTPLAGTAVPPVYDPAALSAAWNCVLQNTGVLWSYADVAIFQGALRDLAPMQGIARVFEELRIEWTGLAAARQVFDGSVVAQPQAVTSRAGAILGYFPVLPGDGIRAWLQPVAHRVVWLKPLDGQTVYSASGIVGNTYSAAAVPSPAQLVGQPALLALLPEN